MNVSLDILRPNCEYMHCEEFARFLMVLVVAPVLPFPADSFFVDKLNVSGKSDCIVLKSYSRRSKHFVGRKVVDKITTLHPTSPNSGFPKS